MPVHIHIQELRVDGHGYHLEVVGEPLYLHQTALAEIGEVASHEGVAHEVYVNIHLTILNVRDADVIYIIRCTEGEETAKLGSVEMYHCELWTQKREVLLFIVLVYKLFHLVKRQ